MSEPSLGEERRAALVADLMAARRDVAIPKRAREEDAVGDARRRVDRAKRALGERGPVWWDDGAPDLNRHMARTTGYAEWFDALPVEALAGG